VTERPVAWSWWVGRVNAYGELWRDSNDFARAMAAVRAIEREHGLVAVDSPGRYGGASAGRAQSRA